MTRSLYLDELGKHLAANNVDDIEEIIAEYDEHFERKQADGFSEEEISEGLGLPSEIAAQFESGEKARQRPAAVRTLLAVGVGFVDILAASSAIALYACVVAVAAVAFACFVAGAALIVQPFANVWFISIPSMPYGGGLLLAAAMFVLGAVSVVSTVYSFRFTRNLCSTYVRWHKIVLDGGRLPPRPVFPLFDRPRTNRRLRALMVAGIAVFIVLMAAAYVYLSIRAGSIEFWHVWNWFA